MQVIRFLLKVGLVYHQDIKPDLYYEISFKLAIVKIPILLLSAF